MNLQVSNVGCAHDHDYAAFLARVNELLTPEPAFTNRRSSV